MLWCISEKHKNINRGCARHQVCASVCRHVKSSEPRLSYLIENFQDGEVVHFSWLDLHLHVASSLRVDAFMPEIHRTHREVAHWASTRVAFTPQVTQILPFRSSYLVNCDQTAQWRHHRL